MNSSDVTIVASESIWLDANRFYDAERNYYEASLNETSKKANPSKVSTSIAPVNTAHGSQSSLAIEIAHAREKIKNFLKSADSAIDSSACNILNRLKKLEQENEELKKIVNKLNEDMHQMIGKLHNIQIAVEELPPKISNPSTNSLAEPKIQNGSSQTADNDDDDIDLFGSDEEDAEAAKLREERLQAYANKKAKKPALVAKSSVILDVKPWDDETDLQAMEKAVRSVQTDGLVWGASKLVPLAYGIKKLQIVAVVEDEKVSIDWLQETICETIEDMVQSVDVAAFNKL